VAKTRAKRKQAEMQHKENAPLNLGDKNSVTNKRRRHIGKNGNEPTRWKDLVQKKKRRKEAAKRLN